MPDIREILKALSAEDKAIWEHARSTMRATYIGTVGATVGAETWNVTDDAFLDLIDIKLAILFDRAGKLNAPNEIVSHEDSKLTEEAIHKAEDMLKASKHVMSEATRKLLAQLPQNLVVNTKEGGW